LVTHKKEEELEQEARIALLNHFSSKSSNQVTNGLTIALGFFAFIMAIEPLRTLFGEGNSLLLIGVPSKMICDIFIAFILFSLIAVGVHTLLRLFYWGELASLILSCEMASRERTVKQWAEIAKEPKQIKENVIEKMRRRGYSGNKSPDSISMYMNRLTIGCSDLYGSKYLTKSKEPYHRRRFSFRYARWRESIIVALVFLAVSIIYIVIS
jgi:phosphotransferase system  glucose/maltose/N-acetylglucosamine-specific IIC component